MKRVVFSLIALFVIVSISFGQNKRPASVTVDTLTNAETVYFDLNPTTPSTKDGVMAFQGLFEQLTGTIAGKAYLEFSVDGTSFVRYANASNSDYVDLFASDTSKIANNGNEFTLSDDGVFGGILKVMPHQYYRMAVVSTGTHTTKVTAKYSYVTKK